MSNETRSDADADYFRSVLNVIPEEVSEEVYPASKNFIKK